MIFSPRAVEVEFLKGLALPLHLFLPFSSASPPPNTHLRVQPAAGHVAGEHAREHGARVLFWKREFEGEEDKGERESDLMLFLGRATTTMLSRTRRKAPHRTFAVPLSHTRDVCPHFSLPRCGIDNSLSRSTANERRSRGLAKPRPCRERASEERERRSDDVEKDMPFSPSSSLLASALLSPRRSPRRFYLAQRRHRRCKLLPAHAQRDDRGGGQGLVRRVHFVSFFSSRKRKTDRAPLSLSSPSSLVPSSRLSGFAAQVRSEREKEREIEREKKETKSGERNEERSLYLLCRRRRRPRARRKKCRLGSKTQKKKKN